MIFRSFRLQDTLQDTHLHTHPQTADGMKPLAALKAARPQEPLPVSACGNPLPATPLLVLPPPAGTHLVTPHLDTVEPREAFAKTAGTKPLKLTGRLRDMAAAGLKPHEQTEGRSLWARPRHPEPARGSPGGMKPPPVRWVLQRLC